LGRYLPTGDVTFAGRLDNQVKIRGFRVEPRTVEAALTRYPQTSAAVVVAREGPDLQSRLIGYVVPELGADLDRRDLTRFLRDRLPDYMVPNTLVLLKRLPLTPNGKLDRRALPDPDITESIFSATFLEPQTPTEQKLAEIWSELLSLSQVGSHDNFFELGGHSLLAMRLLSSICSAYDVDLPLRSLFENATLAKLAAAIDAAPRRDEGLSVPSSEGEIANRVVRRTWPMVTILLRPPGQASDHELTVS
jgi:acyl carrier protein